MITYTNRYGDKIPKSSLGRLFGVIWILVGAMMLSMFTAMTTNAMNTALDGSICKDIDDKEVSGTITRIIFISWSNQIVIAIVNMKKVT